MKKEISIYLLPAGFFLFIMLLWEMFVSVFSIPLYLLPAPSDVLIFFVKRGHILSVHIGVTLFEVLAGFSLGAVVGISLAITVVYSKFVERAIFPLGEVNKMIERKPQLYYFYWR
ncbi:MAG: hypothetical protein FJ110_04085 [Deltaproteobacteria bacterium]|nr:hypothetical protein [Deltaproteobacteria bacterium]